MLPKTGPQIYGHERSRDGSGPGDAGGTNVDSRITLRSGESYDIRWLVVKSGSGYKVRDAQVVGFWMTSFLNDLFQNYITENGNNPRALVSGLEPLAGTLLFAHHTKADGGQRGAMRQHPTRAGRRARLTCLSRVSLASSRHNPWPLRFRRIPAGIPETVTSVAERSRVLEAFVPEWD